VWEASARDADRGVGRWETGVQSAPNRRALYGDSPFDGALSEPRTVVQGRPATCVAGSDRARRRFVNSDLAGLGFLKLWSTLLRRAEERGLDPSRSKALGRRMPTGLCTADERGPEPCAPQPTPNMGRQSGTPRSWLLFALVAVATLAAGHFAYHAGVARRVWPWTSASELSGSAGGDTIGFEPASVDLGDQLWNTSVPFELTFVNRSERPVEIATVLTGCGCTVVDLPPAGQRTVEPGGSRTLLALLRTETTPGRRQYGIDLHLVSGEMCSAIATVNICGTYTLVPEVLDFGRVPVMPETEGGPERELVFESATDEVVGAPVTEARWLECRRVSTAGSRTVMVVRLRPAELEFGLNAATVCVRTSSPVRPEACVRVQAVGMRPLTAVPEQVYLPVGGAATVRFLDAAGRAVRITAVDGGGPDLRVVILESGEVEVVSEVDAPVGGVRRVVVRDGLGREGEVVVTVMK